jgi:hypothetical protein
VSASQLRSKKWLGAVQDGSTEFISLVAPPGSVRAVHRTIKAIQRENAGLSGHLQVAIKALEKLSIQNEILEHITYSLCRRKKKVRKEASRC